MTTAKQAELVRMMREQALKNGQHAHQMRQAGKKWKEIGEHFGVSRQRAQQMAAMYERSLA